MSDEAQLEASLQIAVLALRWYADPKHWGVDDWNVESVVKETEYGNPGAKARRALGRIEKNR